MMLNALKKIAAVSLLLTLGGCAGFGSGNGTYGESVVADPDTVSKLAGDAARRLAIELPPAQTVLAVDAQYPAGPFATSLAEQLRLLGFGVDLCIAPCLPSGGSTHLRYLVAAIGQDGYRVTLSLPAAVVTRAYVKTSEGLQFASVWTRGEWVQ
jgi:hypothetical protein